MKKHLAVGFFLASCLLLPVSSYAQFTTVTATVTDPNNIPYAGAVMNAVLVPSVGGGYTLNGQPYSGRIGPVTLDSTGKFTVNFGDVTLITPGSPQWQITVSSAAATIALPLGTGPQQFTFTSSGTTISGSSPVSLTTSLNALAPKLTNFASGGSGTISCSTSAAVLFETAANTAGCATGFTFSTPTLTIPTNGVYQINGAQAIAFPVPANSNIAIGPSALTAVTTGVNNLAIGASDLSLTTTGNSNTAVGVGALQSAGAANQKNTAVGHNTLNIVTSDGNVGVGENVLPLLTAGTGDTALGAGAGGNTTGSNDTFLGTNAGLNDTTGGSNILIGQGNNLITTGSGNVSIMTGIPTNISATTSNQLDIMDVIVGTGMNVPATSTVTFEGNVTVTGTCTGCSGTPTFPVTVAGTVTSGGIPYFNSTTQESSSAVLTNHAIVTGGGAGGAPTIGNGDFTIDSTAHTLLAGAAGLVDYSAETGSNAFKIPVKASCVANNNGALCHDSSTSNFIEAGNSVLELTSIPGTNCLFKNTSVSAARGTCSAMVDAGTNVVSSEPVSATAYLTATNCSSSASPAVCGSAAAGTVVIAATASTVTVNTTAVTANSEIFLTSDDTLGTKLSVTCNSTLATIVGGLAITARTAGTSFQITSGVTPTVNPLCISYHIIN